MVRWVSEQRPSGMSQGSPGPQAISFIQAHSRSESFKALFREGMGLVETAAAYLDGPGRSESKTLSRALALTYATESMRLTTRLMQIASWLLLQRAVNEGELTPAQATTERHRVRLARQDISAPAEAMAQMPPTFVELCERSVRLQARVLHLDASLGLARVTAGIDAPPPPVAAQIEQLQMAFASPSAVRAS